MPALAAAGRSQPDVDDVDRRGVARDGACILDGQVGTLHDLEKGCARREAEGAELLDVDRVRAELADRIAQRLVETADERGHADNRGDTDDHAEHGQRGPHLVRPQRVDRHADDFAEEARAECRHGLLAPQRFDRIESRGPHRRVEPEEQADRCGNAEAERDRPPLHGRRQWRHFADQERKSEPEDDPDDPAKHRQRHRFGEDLPDDVAATGAERLPQSDLARAFGDDHQHDVHDDDAADDQRERHHADQDGKDAVGGRVVDVQQRVGREHAEVIRFLRPEPPLHPHRHRRIVHGGLDHLGRAGLHQELHVRP